MLSWRTGYLINPQMVNKNVTVLATQIFLIHQGNQNSLKKDVQITVNKFVS